MPGVILAMNWHPIQGGVEILLVASYYRNRDKLQCDGPLGSYADLALLPNHKQHGATIFPTKCRPASHLIKAQKILQCLRKKDIKKKHERNKIGLDKSRFKTDNEPTDEFRLV